MAPYKILLCIFIFLHCASATALSSRDSLSCEMTGGAALTFFHGSGAKASENGLLIGSLDHAFSDNVHALFAVRCGATGSPLIEEAAIQWQSRQTHLSGGFLSNRYGFDKLYRPHSLFNFLFDKPVLWDMYGFGATLNQRFSRGLGMTAASSINSRESGQAHLMLAMDLPRVQAGVLFGVQTYTIENQDNSLTGGFDVCAQRAWFQVHATLKYVDYRGFGHSSNPTMVPGKSTTGFLEFSALPVSDFELCGMSYYQISQKRFNHEFFFEGLDVSWMLLTHFGLGGGCEWQKDDDILSLMPRLFFRAVPVRNHTDIRISLMPTIIDHTATSWRLTGEIWICL